MTCSRPQAEPSVIRQHERLIIQRLEIQKGLNEWMKIQTYFYCELN